MALVVLGLNPDSIKLKRTISSFDKKLISVQYCSLSLKVYCRHVLDDPVVSRYLVDLHNHFVIVPADKAPNNVVFICKAFYYSCLRKELDDSDKRNASSTYQRTNLTKSEILINPRSVLSSFGVNTKDDDNDLPSLYWIPKFTKIYTNNVL